MRVGFIGLGNIGRPMAKRLLAAGHELIVHNRSRPIVDEFVRAGARSAHSPCEIAAESEVVLTALPFPDSDETVYLGPDGLCECARPDQVLISHATVFPGLSRRIAIAARVRGAEFLDAPVSGGPEAAESGALTIMVGGDGDAFERASPLLKQLGTRVRLCGPSGAGSTLKMVNQILVTIHSVATAEALTFAKRIGIDPRVAHEMIMGGLAASALFERNGRRIIERDFEPGARIDLMVKDANLVHNLCDALGLELPVFSRARDSFERAFDQGHGQQDLAAVIESLEEEGRTAYPPAASGPL